MINTEAREKKTMIKQKENHVVTELFFVLFETKKKIKS